ncbi:hypothetical protein MSAN_02121700 [Mycena sanguinolenta]|uniref:Uncharacterized protein n=1 Tax=Mycena sanguinolenta TaxID=230812 RepID=A0A8H6XFH9_9AGAR|nr:hypothetical protein MSAN_02121700 [Mycena sanguinolenta]
MCSSEHNSSDSEDGMDVDDASDSVSSVGSEPLSSAPSDSDLDPWSAFDEFQDLDEPVSHEEMLEQLEEMLGPGDERDDDMNLDAETEASLWDELHGLFHIPDNILFCGPSWTTWTFFMERYCGLLQAGLRSKRFPWANLNKNVLHIAYLEQLNARYNLEEELSQAKQSGPRKLEYRYDNCGYCKILMILAIADPLAILIPPYECHYAPESELRNCIADHFAALVGKRRKDILP